MVYPMGRAKVFAEQVTEREAADVRLMALAVRMAHHSKGKDFTAFLKKLGG